MKKLLALIGVIIVGILSAAALTVASAQVSTAKLFTTKACVNRHSGVIHIPYATRDAEKNCSPNDLKLRLVITKGAWK